MIRLMIVDDQKAIRQALEVMLGLVEDLDVVGTAGNGQEAVEMAADLLPEVILMDLNMPILGGAEATALIVAAHPETSIVVLTTFDDDSSVLNALRAGALGYLTKDSDHLQIAQAVRSARLGQSVLDSDVQIRLLRLASTAAGTGLGATHLKGADPDPARHSSAEATLLTQREKEILHLIGEGLLNRDIASRLTISEATVKTHINNIFTKADLHSRAEAVRYSLTVGGDAPVFT
jgi:DNA-binding NarL/FixJ family response regulator